MKSLLPFLAITLDSFIKVQSVDVESMGCSFCTRACTHGAMGR